MPRESRSDPELHKVAEHLAYELEMLRATAVTLAEARYKAGSVERNALVESFTLHARALLHFLFPAGRVDDDDVLASDYFRDPLSWERLRGDLPGALYPVRARVGKEIAHLTYSRLSVTAEAKQWRVLEVAAAVERLMRKFAEAAERLDGESRQKLGSAALAGG